jgi:predicted DNA-binding transcriptional regulator AlpA
MRGVGKMQVEASSERYLKKRELAAMLGFCERSIMRFVERGQLPRPIYISTQPRWRHSEIEEWLSRQREGKKS